MFTFQKPFKSNNLNAWFIPCLVVTVFLAAYSFLFFMEPSDRYLMDITTNYPIVESLLSNDVFHVAFKFDTGLNDNLLYKLLMFWNLEKFNYSLEFIRILTYITSVLILLVIFSCICLLRKKQRVIGIAVLSLFALNFYGVYDVYSSLDSKLVILMSLIAILLFVLALKSKHSWLYFTFVVSGIVMERFAFFLPFHAVYCGLAVVGFLKKYKLNNWFNISFGVLLLVLLGLGFWFDYPSLSISFEMDFSQKVLSSFLLPQTRYIKGDYSYLVFVILSIITLLFLALNVVSDVLARKEGYSYWLTVLLGLAIVYEVFLMDKSYFASSEVYTLNSFIIGANLYKLANRIPALKFSKDKRKVAVEPNTTVHHLGYHLGIFTMLVATLFSSMFFYLRNDVRTGMYDAMSYAKQYDNGYIDGDMGIFADHAGSRWKDSFEFFTTNGLIDKPDYELPVDETCINKKTANYLRGVGKERRTNVIWLQSNFAIELFTADGFLNLSLFSTLESNKVTLYINNVEIGVANINKGSNYYVFDVGTYVGKQIILRGTFEKEYRGPLDRKGDWACTMMDLNFTNVAGLHHIEKDGSSWTNSTFGFFYDKVENSKVYTFYNSPSLPNNALDIFINGKYVSHEIIGSHFTKVYVDLHEYIGRSASVSFKVEKVRVEENGERLLGVNYVSTGDWIKKFSADVKVTGYYMTMEVGDPDFVERNHEISVLINGVNRHTFEISKQVTKTMIRCDDLLGQTIHLDFDLSFGYDSKELNNKVAIQFSNIYGFHHVETDGSSWTDTEFGIYFPVLDSSKVFKFYNPKSLGDNGVSVYLNDVYYGHFAIGQDFTDVCVEMDHLIGQSVEVKFKADDHRVDSQSGLRLALHYVSMSDVSFVLEHEMLIEHGFLIVEFSNWDFIIKHKTVSVFLNGEKLADESLSLGVRFLAYPVSEYIGQTVNIRMHFDDGYEGTLEGNGINFACHDYFGFLNGGSTDWTSSRFGFYYENAPQTKRYRFYNPHGTTNGVTVYVNGVRYNHFDFVDNTNDITVDFRSLNLTDAMVIFEVDNCHKDGLDPTIIGANYVGSSDWVFSEEIEVHVDSYWLSLSFTDNEFVRQNGHVSISINGEEATDYPLVVNDSAIIPMGDYLDQTVTLKFDFEFGFEGTLADHGLTMTFKDKIGFHHFESDGSSWTEDYFGFFYRNVTDSLVFRFYTPVSYGANGVNVYINGTLVGHESICVDFCNVTVNLNAYYGQDVAITFEVDSYHYDPGNPKPLGLNYVSTKTISTSFTHNMHIEGHYLNFEVVDRDVLQANDTYYFYVNGNLLLTRPIDATSPIITVDVGDYVGEDVELTVLCDKGFDQSKVNSSFRISSADTYGVYDPDSQGTVWTRREFGYYIENVTESYTYVFYEISIMCPNELEVLINGVHYANVTLLEQENFVYIDLSQYVGQSVTLDFRLESSYYPSNADREIGVVISRIEHNEVEQL